MSDGGGRRILLAALAAALCVSGLRAGDVAVRRAQRLRHGINTSHWFAQSPSYAPRHLQSHTRREDIELIRAMGFDHIRLSLEPAPLYNEASPAVLNRAHLEHLDRALDLILQTALSVIVDPHPSERFKKRITADREAVLRFARFWESLARHLSRRDPERVFLEVINEPQVEELGRWEEIQTLWAEAMRRGAPDHTLIATAHRWSGPYEIVKLTPLKDPNVIYNFHFYEPHLFTHQGAVWGAPEWPHVKGLPYPSDPTVVEATAAGVGDERVARAVRRYGRERWNARRIQCEIGRVAQWGARHGVPLICNEFGVYRRYAAQADRAAWLRDVVRALRSHGIGWAMWDYQGGFAVVNRAGERKVPDVLTLQALGLDAGPNQATPRGEK